MNRRGFTLVELLAVIVILAVILTIAVPNILGIISDARSDAYDAQVDLVIDAAKKYVVSEGDSITWTSDQATITVAVLQTAGYLEDPIDDPRDGTEMTGTVTVTRSGTNYTYAYTP